MSCISSTLCAKSLFMNLEPDCENRIFSGISQGSVIFAKSDIESFSVDSQCHNLITNITLKTGAKAYKWINDSKNPFTGSNTSMNANDTFANDFTHTLSGMVMSNGCDTTRMIEILATGKFVAIIENEYVGDMNGDYYHYQIYGLQKGLQASNIVTSKYENQDAWTCELQETNVTSAGKFVLAKTNTVNDYTLNITPSTTTNTVTVDIKTTDTTPVTIDVNFIVTPISDNNFNVKGEYVDEDGKVNYIHFIAKYNPTSTEKMIYSSQNDGVITFTVGTSTATPPTGTAEYNDWTMWYDSTCELIEGLLV